MGTNYYIREKICGECGRFDEIHIGKSSGGRDFTIRHHKEHYNSWNEFKKFVKGKRIFNEYGYEVTVDSFLRLVLEKKKDHPFAHRDNLDYDMHGLYIDGFYFLNEEFC